jgi:hypothetical protein
VSPGPALEPAPPTEDNPFIRQLRAQLATNPRVFAQLAEELRKEGKLDEAISVCHEGMREYPKYPHARITLGRALTQRGDLEEARYELETALGALPQSVLARRAFGECLEQIGDLGGARAQYQAALALAPDNEAVAERLQAIEQAVEQGVAPTSAVGEPRSDPMLEVPEDLHRPPDQDLPPIPLVPAEESFELENPYDVPSVWREKEASAEPAPAEGSKEQAEAGPVPAASSGGAQAVPTTGVRRAADEPALPPLPPLPKQPSATDAAAAEPAKREYEDRLDSLLPTGGSASPAPAKVAPVKKPLAAAEQPPTAVRKPSAPARKPPAPAKRPAARGTQAPAPAAGRPVVWPARRLAENSVPDLIEALHVRRWTGVLALGRMGLEKTIRFQEGRLEFATSSDPDERLGELLLKRGRITVAQYLEAGSQIRKGKRLGSILVDLAALKPKELVAAILDHAQEIIYGAFQWTDGLYQLRERLELGPEDITLSLSTPELILQGISRIEGWSRIQRGVGSLESVYVRNEGDDEDLEELTLSPERREMLERSKAPRDVATICRDSSLTDFEVFRTLWAFRVIGIMQRLPPSIPSRT